ncbi:TerD family protein [Aureibacter tunicatorum]|nr:TerD family protein [Aureibacter tunicatorum]BDD05717.1 chemical-damaging agent resistance protein C [Aureibacter tunicatorum]
MHEIWPLVDFSVSGGHISFRATGSISYRNINRIVNNFRHSITKQLTMAINLKKGQRANIEAQKFNVGLGWDVSRGAAASADLDVVAFMIDEEEKLISDDFMIFYNQLKSPDGAVTHSGDNLTGDGDGDDETIMIDLGNIDSRVQQIIFTVTIHEGEEKNQNFGQVRNSYIRIVDSSSKEEMMIYELDEDYSVETSIEFGRLYKRSGQWKFEAMGTGYMKDLQHFVDRYQR